LPCSTVPKRVFSLEGCYHWLSSVQKGLPTLYHTVISTLVDGAVDLAHDTQKVTPRYEHIVNKEKCHDALCKKQLLGWPSRATLNTRTIGLHAAMADCSRLHTSWVGTPVLREVPEFKENLDTADAILKTASEAILVIAALNVIHEQVGADQIAQANRGNPKKSSWPTADQTSPEHII